MLLKTVGLGLVVPQGSGMDAAARRAEDKGVTTARGGEETKLRLQKFGTWQKDDSNAVNWGATWGARDGGSGESVSE
jgi:hypothetical protein